MRNYRFTFSEQELDRAAKQFIQLTMPKLQFAFFGSMGVGKTTFIKALCKNIGTPDLVSSPTFAIVNEYTTPTSANIYHFDFYRIKQEDELLDIGFYDYCTQNDYCFIEWPEKAGNIIPEDFVHVTIKEIDEGIRELSFSV